MFSKPKNKTYGDLDINEIKNEFLRQADNDNYNFLPIKKPSATLNHLIDKDYFDLKYLEANSKDINFKRDKELGDSTHLNEILSLKKELIFNYDLTYNEIKILIIQKKYLNFHANFVSIKHFKLMANL